MIEKGRAAARRHPFPILFFYKHCKCFKSSQASFVVLLRSEAFQPSPVPLKHTHPDGTSLREPRQDALASISVLFVSVISAVVYRSILADGKMMNDCK